MLFRVTRRRNCSPSTGTPDTTRSKTRTQWSGSTAPEPWGSQTSSEPLTPKSGSLAATNWRAALSSSMGPTWLPGANQRIPGPSTSVGEPDLRSNQILQSAPWLWRNAFQPAPRASSPGVRVGSSATIPSRLLGSWMTSGSNRPEACWMTAAREPENRSAKTAQRMAQERRVMI